MEAVLEIVSAETGVPVAALTRATRMDTLIEDSLEFLSLITAVRAKFGEFPDAWVAHVNTVGDLIDLVESLIHGVVSGRAV